MAKIEALQGPWRPLLPRLKVTSLTHRIAIAADKILTDIYGREMTILQRVADYELLQPLGAGPLGTVYKAYDHKQGRDVALRMMTADVVRWDADLRSRFGHEGRAISALKHPNIAEWYEVGEHGDGMYVAAELISGRDLKRLIAERAALPVEKRIGVMHQVATALAYAHTAGVLHRDIRPANIFLQPDGVAKVADFGLASMTAGSLMKAAVRWGTPLYLCPEQIRNKSYDVRSEIFAVGTVFYEFLTGVHPFQHSNSNRALDDIVSEEHLPSLDPLADAPAGLCSIMARCLAKDPGERFAGMSELAEALADLVDDVAKECQAMLVELQIATHRLKRAAAVADAPPEIGELARNIRQLLSSDHRRDYASLDRLMATLAEQGTVIHALTKGPVRRPGPPRSQTATRPETGEHSVQPAAARSGPEPAHTERVSGPALACCEEPTPGVSPDTMQTEASRQEPLEPLDAGELEYLNLMMTEIGGRGSAPEPAREAEIVPMAPGLLPLPTTESQEVVPYAAAAHVARPARLRIRTRALVTAAALVALCVAVASGWQHRVALYNMIRAGILAAAPSAPPAAAEAKLPATSSEPQATYGPAVEVLVREARQMAEQGRSDTSRVFLQRALDLEPRNEEARALLAELDTKTKELPVTEDPLQQQISVATSLLEAGQLRKARAEIARLAVMNPEHPALPALRKSLEAKSADTRDAARKKTAQTDTARRKLSEETWSRRAGELFRAGKYGELSLALEQWALDSPSSTQLPVLRSQSTQLQQLLGAFQSAVSDRRYTDAAVALAHAESLNPADPALPELKRLLESKRAAARARLTVVRLGEPGVVMLDSVPLGQGGEVQSAPVAIGEHVLSVKVPGAPAFSAVHDFRDGENVSFVYDGRALRPVGASDLESAAARKVREQVHRFGVEHPHGLLRGSCKGELLVNGFDVTYKPEAGSHGFQIPFARLVLRAEGRGVELRFASDNNALQSFRIRNANEADALKQLWAKLQQLSK